MEIWEEYKFTGAENKVWQIYKAYEVQAKKRGDFRKYLPAKTDPRQAKNWKYFEQVYQNFSHDSMFDPYIFMEAQFRNVPKDRTLFPAQLKTKPAIEKYKDHREALKVKDPITNTEAILESLAATCKFLKKWWQRNSLPTKSYKEFFTPKDGELMSEGMLFCLQSMISKYFMSVSKHFRQEYGKLDPDMRWEVVSPDDLKRYKIKLMLDKDAYNFAKEIFGEEII